MSLMDSSDAIVVTSIGFSEGMMEIGYLEKREQTDSVGMMKTLFVDTSKLRLTNLYDEIVELSVDVVEAALLALRNPEPVLDPRKRLRNRPSSAPTYTEEADEEDDLS